MGEEKPSETQAAEKTLVVEENSAGNEDTANGNSLDFTGDNTAANQVTTPRVGDKYDPRPQEDSARRTIAYLLIGLLWLIVSGILILLGFKSISVDNIKDFGVVLSPIIALVSAATGFYYGTKSTDRAK